MTPLALPTLASATTQLPQQFPTVSAPRETFNMLSIEQFLVSNTFLNKLAGKIGQSAPAQPVRQQQNAQHHPLANCRGCSDPNHFFRACPKMADYLQRGLCAAPVQQFSFNTQYAPPTSQSFFQQNTSLQDKKELQILDMVTVAALKRKEEIQNCTRSLIVANQVEDLRTIPLKLGGSIMVEAILDEGLQIMAIRCDVWEKLSLPLLSNQTMVMESANASKEVTLGLLRDLPACIGCSMFYLQVQVVKNVSYEMLLGQPFLTLTEA
ncbi:hypothetical protein P691DRAFT_784123 [Macrolepiota fuliginosa MF-IS2]|uniref:CCHC-type domain-containing protein n=1 Tax=Macrolepiota fuliginosa MF-IS2 TaxID=1400762 RepID=A0A9P5WY84_9AGAR|nr:hypothetical protein P691DRAFT_784123 [Macrolepiota fuliginosa MF-IS2]